MSDLSAKIEEAIAAWEAKGPTSLTVALLAEVVYAVRDERRDADPRTHGLNHAPLPVGALLSPGFCAGCDVDSDNAAAGGAEGLAEDLEDVLIDYDVQGTISGWSAVGAYFLAKHIVASDWLAAHVARAKAEALREYADLAESREKHMASRRKESTADGRERNVWGLVRHELRADADRIEGR